MCDVCDCKSAPDLIVTDAIRRQYERLTEAANERREPNYEILVADPDEGYFHVERDLYAAGPDEAAEEFLRLAGPNDDALFGVRYKRLGGVTFYRANPSPRRAQLVHPALI